MLRHPPPPPPMKHSACTWTNEWPSFASERGCRSVCDIICILRDVGHSDVTKLYRVAKIPTRGLQKIWPNPQVREGWGWAYSLKMVFTSSTLSWVLGLFLTAYQYVTHVRSCLLTHLWLHGSKPVKMLIYLPLEVCLVHLKVQHCQTLRVVSTFTGQNESTVFDW